ncbi:hypothetical protein BD779DRAFT_1549163, partial [Infundibulicybe gibba]
MIAPHDIAPARSRTRASFRLIEASSDPEPSQMSFPAARDYAHLPLPWPAMGACINGSGINRYGLLTFGIRRCYRFSRSRFILTFHIADLIKKIRNATKVCIPGL